jgi:hypothetical protein
MKTSGLYGGGVPSKDHVNTTRLLGGWLFIWHKEFLSLLDKFLNFKLT